MTRCGVVVLAAMAVFVAVAAAATPQPGPMHACGWLTIDYRPTQAEHYAREYLTARSRVTCAKARQLISSYNTDKRPCSGSSCFRSYPGGWWCDSATPGDWPIIAECAHGKLLWVHAFVHSKIKGPR